MTAELEPQPYITRVWARNFRSIEHAELDLEPLTVLVGPNASGKSNLLDILGFLADAARHGLETAITRRGGIDSIGRRMPTGRALGPEIGFRYEGRRGELEYSFALTRRGKGEYRIKREFARLKPTDPELGTYEIEIVDGRLTKPDAKKLVSAAKSPETESEVEARSLADQLNQRISATGAPMLYLISREPLLADMLSYILRSLSIQERSIPSLDLLRQALRFTWQNLSDIEVGNIFPNALRSPQLITEGRNFASVLRETVKKNRFLPALKETLALAVPGVRDIRVTRAGSYYVVELKHESDIGAKRSLWFDLFQESDGTLRLLAMLTLLFQDPAPSLIGLEEPELAIHPGAMAVLADTIKEASLRGQVLVTTHSPDLINLLPIESIRAVTAEDGSTRVGRVAEHQLKSVKDNLFSARRASQHGGPPAGGRGGIDAVPTIVPVVEGAGDVAALPDLLGRILRERFNRTDVFVAQGKSGVVTTNGRQKLESKLENFLRHAQNKPECDAILVLLDADDDCPVNLAQRLWERGKRLGLTSPVEIVCAHRSYESWFLASLDTIKGQRGISDTAVLSQAAEDVSSPKQWLTDQMPPGQAYKETIHQASLSRSIDIVEAHKNSRSFRRLCHALEQLLAPLSSQRP